METLTADISPLEVTFLPAFNVGITSAPGMKYADEIRDLDKDLLRLKTIFNAGTLICLLETRELEEFQVPNLLSQAQAFGIQSIHYPVKDGGVPVSPRDFNRIIERTLEALTGGKIIVGHCKDGLGRSGVFAACCLLRLHIMRSPFDAMRAVRRVRPGAIKNGLQEDFVMSYSEFLDTL